MNPRYPIYIPSKGRWRRPGDRSPNPGKVGAQLTSRALDRMGVPHFIVVEEAELERYTASKYPTATLLVLDPSYRDRHETLDDYGHTRSFGAGPARNFAWEHSIGLGAERHWDVDDNIDGFFRVNYNLKTPVADGTVLRAMEDFVDRYQNVADAGPNYFMFVSRKSAVPPFVANTRIYSCSLLRNDLPFRWRLRMNEDTDLSLRILKAGLCTILFNAFVQFKVTTQTMGGGYNSAFYAKEGTRWKTEMLRDAHPDVVEVVERFGRIHHYVDYQGHYGGNRLLLKPGLDLRDEIDDYGMKLQRRLNGRWYDIRTPYDEIDDAAIRSASPSRLVEAPPAYDGDGSLFGAGFEDAIPANPGPWR